MTNKWPQIPEDVSLWKNLAYQTLPKAMYISSATAWVAPDLLKALAILSDTIARRSKVDRENGYPYV